MAGVQGRLFRRIEASCNTFENLLPNAALAPTREPIVDGLVRTVLSGTILPAAADFQNMHDPAQYASIILALGAGLVGRQMGNDLRPLLIVEPKQIRIHGLGLQAVDQAIESNEPCLGLDPRESDHLPSPVGERTQNIDGGLYVLCIVPLLELFEDGRQDGAALSAPGRFKIQSSQARSGAKFPGPGVLQLRKIE